MLFLMSRSLLFFLGFFWLQLHTANALISTLDSNCVRPCFKPCAPDYQDSCVCASLADTQSVNDTFTCLGDHCGWTFAGKVLPNLAQACSTFLEEPIIFNGTTIQTTTTTPPFGTKTGTDMVTSEGGSGASTALTTPTSTRTFKTATDLGLFPTITTSTIRDFGTITPVTPSPTPSSSPTTEAGVQDGPTPAEQQKTQPSSNSSRPPLLAVYILAPITVVVILVALFFVWRRRKTARRSIASFTGVDGWDSSSPVVRRPMGGGKQPLGRDEENRYSRRSMGQVGKHPIFNFPPPTIAPPTRRPSMRRSNKTLSRDSVDKELPRLPPPVVQRSITTISECSPVSGISVGEGGREGRGYTEDELQRVFREVRKGYRPDSQVSSVRTSMDWSMQEPVSGTRYSNISGPWYTG